MPVLARIRGVFRAVVRREALDRELDEELRSYVEMLTEEKVRNGMDPAEARRMAMMELGGVEQVKTTVRDTQHGAALDALIQDVRFTLRTLRSSPGFTFVVVLTLALGIGANTALFSTINATLLRSLPFVDSHRLVAANKCRNATPAGPVSRLDYFDYSDTADSFTGLAAYCRARSTLTGSEAPEVVDLQFVTVNFFQVLGVDPILGRHLLSEDEAEGSADVALISYGLWQRRFGGDRNVIGKTVTLNVGPQTVVGVMPAGYRFMSDADVWTLVKRGDFYVDRERDSHSLQLVGRLKDGVSFEQAQSEVDAIATALQEQYPDTNKGKSLMLFDLQEYMVGDARTSLFLLLATTGMVLLIACGNVAGLMLARGQRRLVEMAMRSALGAPRQRLVRQLVTESVIHTVLAGCAGIAVAFLCQSLILRLLPLGRPGLPQPSIDGVVLLFNLVVSIVVGVVVGVVPALKATSSQPWSQLKSSTRMSEGRSAGRLRNILVVAQVAISVILLIGSGLMIRTLANLTTVDLGFDPGNLLAGTVSIEASEYPEPAERNLFFTTLLERVEALPGVLGASAVCRLPIATGGMDWPIWHSEEPRPASGESEMALARWSMPGYFDVMGIPLLRGRDIAATDTPDSPRVLMISAATAEMLFPDQEPLGRMVKLGWMDEPYEVIGVVGNAKLNGVRSQFLEAMYMATTQMQDTFQWLAVRSAGDPLLLVEPIREILHDMDSNAVFSQPKTMDSILDSNLAGFRTVMAALGLLAGVALLLTSIGLYGVLSYHVSQRTNEIGIRLALGAQTAKVLTLILRRGVIVVAAGLVLGLIGSLIGTRLVEDLLFETSRLDPFAYLGAAAFLGSIALLACMLPAWRATRISPVEVLRRE